MGIRHLKKIEDFLRKNEGKPFSKTQIRDELKIDYNTVLDVLSYLIDEKRITKKEDKYQWGSK